MPAHIGLGIKALTLVSKFYLNQVMKLMKDIKIARPSTHKNKEIIFFVLSDRHFTT